jgi:hypothetical protein
MEVPIVNSQIVTHLHPLPIYFLFAILPSNLITNKDTHLFSNYCRSLSISLGGRSAEPKFQVCWTMDMWVHLDDFSVYWIIHC